MKNGKLLGLYSDDLISAFGPTTDTELSTLLNGEISHDQVQRLLARAAWPRAINLPRHEPHARTIESLDDVLIVDDSIAKKPYAMKTTILSGTTTIRSRGTSKASILL